MPNPDSSTPSIQARNLAVKPAGMTWSEFICYCPHGSTANLIALAYAADLDKADKQNREVLRLLSLCQDDAAEAILRSSLIPDPIDPDLLEAAKEAHVQLFGSYMPDQDSSNITILMNLARRGRELAKEQDRG